MNCLYTISLFYYCISFILSFIYLLSFCFIYYLVPVFTALNRRTPVDEIIFYLDEPAPFAYFKPRSVGSFKRKHQHGMQPAADVALKRNRTAINCDSDIAEAELEALASMDTNAAGATEALQDVSNATAGLLGATLAATTTTSNTSTVGTTATRIAATDTTSVTLNTATGATPGSGSAVAAGADAVVASTSNATAGRGATFANKADNMRISCVESILCGAGKAYGSAYSTALLNKSGTLVHSGAQWKNSVFLFSLEHVENAGNDPLLVIISTQAFLEFVKVIKTGKYVIQLLFHYNLL